MVQGKACQTKMSYNGVIQTQASGAVSADTPKNSTRERCFEAGNSTHWASSLKGINRRTYKA